MFGNNLCEHYSKYGVTIYIQIYGKKNYDSPYCVQPKSMDAEKSKWNDINSGICFNHKDADEKVEEIREKYMKNGFKGYVNIRYLIIENDIDRKPLVTNNGLIVNIRSKIYIEDPDGSTKYTLDDFKDAFHYCPYCC